jgi:type VI secretion system secreted protein VgrG
VVELHIEQFLQARLTSDAFDAQGAFVRSVRGAERLGTLSEVEVVATWPADQDTFAWTGDPEKLPHLDAIVGSAVSIVFELHAKAGGERAAVTHLRCIHGVVASATDRLDAQSGDLAVTMRVLPRAQNLALVETYQVFLETSLPDILRAKLEAGGLVEGNDFEVRLGGTYEPIDFVAQYRETDLAFVLRICEHRGITAFVEHDGDRDRLVFTDQNEGFPRSTSPAELGVNRAGSMVLGNVMELSATKRVIPSLYVEMDYNYRTPQIDLTSQHELADAYGGGYIEYGAHFRDPGDGATLAKLRAEERRATQLVFEGTTSHAALAPGKRVKIVDDVRFPELDLLIVEVRHELVQPASIHDAEAVPRYECRFVGIPASRPYRPARVTPRPRIHGVLHAIIDPLPNDEIGEFSNLDDMGRYTVRMYFDVAGSTREISSKRVRMIQNHAGGYYGTHMPLKPGIEVMVAFVDGDPDRPVIVGSIPNPVTPSPVTIENSTMNRMKTVSGVLIEMKDRG